MGGVKGTKYPLKTRNHAPRTTRHAPRPTENQKQCPSTFLRKGGGQQVCIVSKWSVENARRSCAHKIPILIVIWPGQKPSRKEWKKLMKNNGTINPNPDTYLQSMTKAPAQFQKDWLKTVRGVASTSYPSHCVYGRTESRTEGRTHFNSLIRLRRRTIRTVKWP